MTVLGGGALPGPPKSLGPVEVIATGLRFPEGPVWFSDASILVVEMDAGCISRVGADGSVTVVAEPGGSPNGLAVGPDGAIYVCNSGGPWTSYSGGRIERLDLSTGEVTVLYRECDGESLSAPNDIAFDDQGGFWFTDFGKGRDHCRDYGRILYAQPDGSAISCVFPNLHGPNGIGLSQDGSQLYFAETFTGRLYRRNIVAPGHVEHSRDDDVATLLCGLPGLQRFDSLAVDARGRVCVGTLNTGCVTVVAPDGSSAEQYQLPEDLFDIFPTNLCFDDVGTTAYVTLSEKGRLVRCPWPPAG